ncbi:unnamed protein product [Oppiella nova]|uniref:Uncharacterized protein n=1 Tax=Oppiella nova TaxID=334625 RepID=A0A7R9MQ70_9ACAR|nr:unnamed protein product [Oppiella nova]CAG2181629.1 unnamed protein product [Oppiella nova]
MFSHIKSFKHRKNILKEYNYDIIDLSEIDMEISLRNIQEKHGISCIKTCDRYTRLKECPEPVPEPTPTPYPNPEPKPSPTPQIPLVEIKDNDSDVSESPKDNAFIREDILLPDFESHKIIKTYESDGKDIYYCCYCDLYYHSFKDIKHHIRFDAIHTKV